MPARQSELTVIVRAKDLASYVLTVTDKSPKRFRFTLVAKLQGYALDVIEDLYRANEVFVPKGGGEEANRRLDYQHRAITGMKLLGYMAQLAMEQGCILPKQYEQITKRLHDCRNLCGAWINADRKRLGAATSRSAAAQEDGGRVREAQQSSPPQPSMPAMQLPLFEDPPG